jgi:hypothetical protein
MTTLRKDLALWNVCKALIHVAVKIENKTFMIDVFRSMKTGEIF